MKIKALTISTALSCVLVMPCSAGDQECGLHRYAAIVTGVYDADTITADIDLGFHTWIHGERLRLFGIDAPEIQSRENVNISNQDKRKGIVARNALHEKIYGKTVEICTIKQKTSNKDIQGKYGRYLARVFFNGENINEWLVKNDYAVKRDW